MTKVWEPKQTKWQTNKPKNKIEIWYTNPLCHALLLNKVLFQSHMRTTYNQPTNQRTDMVACARPKTIQWSKRSNKPRQDVGIWKTNLSCHVLHLYQVSIESNSRNPSQLKDEPTNGWTDKASLRIACPQLKSHHFDVTMKVRRRSCRWSAGSRVAPK